MAVSNLNMATGVVGINAAIALGLLYLAWRLWQLRKTLAQVNGTLVDMERQTRVALLESQQSMLLGQQGLVQLGGRYRTANQQLKQVKQLLLLLGWMQGYMRRQSR